MVARYTQDYYAEEAAITMNESGDGQVVYVGTMGDVDLYDTLVNWFIELAEVQPPLAAPEGVAVSERWQGNRRLLFILNHTDREQEVTPDGSYATMLRDAKIVDGTITIAPRDVWLLQDSART